ncbi:hypothetical protein CTH30272_03079 [Allocatenococcus thiocycli]|nr:hypothetical protein CTH30272_03079 [Catenococcus thiocycli]
MSKNVELVVLFERLFLDVKELSKLFSVTKRTAQYWFTGEYKPSQKVMDVLTLIDEELQKEAEKLSQSASVINTYLSDDSYRNSADFDDRFPLACLNRALAYRAITIAKSAKKTIKTNIIYE